MSKILHYNFLFAEMARHSVVLSELEERLQHSEEMGLKARISASQVVKRIKDLLEKYYKPPPPSPTKDRDRDREGGNKGRVTSNSSPNAARLHSASTVTTRKHMDRIQQELMVIFDKLEDIGQPDLTLDVGDGSGSDDWDSCALEENDRGFAVE